MSAIVTLLSNALSARFWDVRVALHKVQKVGDAISRIHTQKDAIVELQKPGRMKENQTHVAYKRRKRIMVSPGIELLESVCCMLRVAV